MNFIKPLRRAEKGFTLIELLIVVAIIGILAAVIIPNLSSFLKTGKMGAARSEAENVKTAATAFYADTNGWPTSTDNLTNTLDNPGTKLYVTGSLVGTYIWDNTPGDTSYGLITSATYPAGANPSEFTWDPSGQTWK